MTKSQTRKDSEAAEAFYAGMLMSLHKDVENPTMLMCGTGGNPPTHSGKPGLDHPEWFDIYKLTTLDFDAKWNPDIVGDITRPKDWWNGNPYDLIHMTQVIEHIPNLWEVSGGLKEITKPRVGYVILDTPFSYPYHGEENSFGDYWRISKDGMKVLFEKDFDIIHIWDTPSNTSCLLKAKE